MSRTRKPNPVRCECVNELCGLAITMPDDRLMRGEGDIAKSKPLAGSWRHNGEEVGCPTCSAPMRIDSDDVILFSDKIYTVQCGHCEQTDVVDAMDLVFELDRKVCVQCKRYGTMSMVPTRQEASL